MRNAYSLRRSGPARGQRPPGPALFSFFTTLLLSLAGWLAPDMALAGRDIYGLGNGSAGALTVGTTGVVINTYATITAPLAAGAVSLPLNSSAGFAANDLVMIWQTTGLTPVPASGTAGPLDLNTTPVGRWELGRVASVSGNTLVLQANAALVNAYAVSGCQVVRVPEYTTVTINPGRSVTAMAWNGSTGGVVAFLCNGTFTNNGSIDVRGRGFRGGQTVADISGTTGASGLDQPAPHGGQKGEGIALGRYGAGVTGRGNVANGAGGGVAYLSGGGGGAGGGAGGQGGNSDLYTDGNRAVGGQGGKTFSNFSGLTRLLLGGGGGAGHTTGNDAGGGVGGGVVFLRSSSMAGSGNCFANGTSAGSSSGGASGGGGGGTLYVRVAGGASAGTLQATGGTGGSSSNIAVGPGGGGGGGYALFQKGSGTATLTGTSTIGANPGTQLDPGAPGGSAYGATAGSTGNSTTLSGGFATPATPVVVTPANSSLTNNPRPTITGTAQSGNSIEILVDGTLIATIATEANGNWTYTPTASLSDGAHTVSVNATLPAQQTVAFGNSTTFIVDTTAPTAPVAITPANGSSTSDNTPTYSGTAEANIVVTVYVDDSSVGTTTASGSGAWSLTLPTALADGSHTVRAMATDAVGNNSANSNTNTFTVDSTTPTVTLSSGTGASGSSSSAASFAYSVTFSESVTGFALTDLSVSNGTPTGFTGAGASYSFSITPTAAGPVTVSIPANAAQDAAGNGSSASATYSLTYAPVATLTAIISSQTNVRCNGATTGAATVTASGGTAPYTYQWSNGAQTASITGLGAGTYNVVVTDAANRTASASASATITEPTALSLVMSKTDATTNGAANGTAAVQVSGGTPGYAYLWSNGATTATISNLTAGTYTVFVTDANGCQANNSVTVGQPAAGPTLASLSPTSGPVGQSVVLTGTGIEFGNVRFGTISATVTSRSSTQLTVTVPAGVGPGPVTVTVVEPGRMSNGLTFTVTAPANQAPTALALSNTSLAENNPANAPVGTLSTTDPDAGDTFTYTLVSGAGSDDNASFSISGNTLRLTAAADFETKNSYAVRLRTTDGGGLSFEQTFTVAITNVNEAPALAAQTRSIVENSANGTLVGAPLVATDPDANTTLSYAITAGNGTGSGAFAINSSTGQLSVADAGQLDFETTPVFTLTVRVLDNGSPFLSSTATVTVNLTDVNETLPDLTVSTGTTAAPVAIAAGTYNNVTVTGTGVATLSGAVTVNGAFLVQGTLNTNCQPLTGAGSFTLAAGATLQICDGAGITASGNTGAVQLSGVRSYSPDASYVYNNRNPSAPQFTGNGLPSQVRNLTLTTVSTTFAQVLSQSVAIRQVLTMPSSNSLNTGPSSVTLLSDATGTALVVANGGVVSGNLIAQRYIDPSTNAGLGYRHMALTANSTTVASYVGSGGTAPVFNTTYNTSATPLSTTPFPTVFGYDQARLATSPATGLAAFDKGWFSPAGTDVLTGGRITRPMAYTVQLPGASTLSVATGDRQAFTYALARNSGPTADEAGWNFVANPFLAPLDWSTVTATQRTGVDAAMYVYESTSQYGGQYRSYANGFGSSPLIGLGQSFWVRVSTGATSGTLALDNSHRVTDYARQASVRRGAADDRPQLQLTLAGNGLSDALTVYAQAGATAGFDREFDAQKLWNPNGLSVATLAASGEALAIDGRPAFPLGQPVPLTVQAPQAGTYSLTATDLLNLPAGTDVVLVDLSTGTRTPLLAGTRYSLTLPAGTTAGRLQLEVVGRALSTSSQLAQQLSLYPNPTEGQVQLVRPAAWGGLQVQVLNSIGQPVLSTRLAAGEQTLSVQQLPVGVYTLHLTTQQGQTLTKRLVRQ